MYITPGRERVQIEVSSRVDELATDPISHHLHIATLELTEIKLLRLSFSTKPLLSGGRNMTRMRSKQTFKYGPTDVARCLIYHCQGDTKMAAISQTVFSSAIL